MGQCHAIGSHLKRWRCRNAAGKSWFCHKHKRWLSTILFGILGALLLALVGDFIWSSISPPTPTEKETLQRMKNMEDTKEPTGFLSPGNVPTPPNPCGPPGPGRFVLLAGGQAIVIPRGVRHYPAIRLNQQPIIWITDDDQGILVSAELRRDDGRGVATLHNNRFGVNTNNYYELRRPNRHEVTVIDKSGTVALRAEFLNEQAFRIQGQYSQPGYGKVIIGADDFTLLTLENNSVEKNCIRDAMGGGLDF